jgi:Ser-tRNA(Ala) deacylase AlaX
MIRHSTAHLLAYAVKELFPDAQVTIGPVIDNGFYYDFAYKRPFTPEDLAGHRAAHGELAKKDEKVERRVLPRDEASAFQGHRRALQGRDHRQHPGRPGREPVPRGRLRGPVPRPARAQHGQAASTSS